MAPSAQAPETKAGTSGQANWAAAPMPGLIGYYATHRAHVYSWGLVLLAPQG
ncbi:MAG: hypothetical protein ACPGUX_04120 [Halocynthiibacter sp.]